MRTGRFNPTFVREQRKQIIDCDTVILAIGQAPNLDFLKPEDGVRVSPRGLIVADPSTLMTTAAGVFAGGDCVFGPRLIIDSVGDGKRIAIAVDEYLTGRRHPDTEVEVEVLDPHQMAADYMALQPPCRSPCCRSNAAPASPRSRSASTSRPPCRRPGGACGVGSTRSSRATERTLPNAFCAAGALMSVPSSASELVPLERIDLAPEVLEEIRQNEQAVPR